MDFLKFHSPHTVAAFEDDLKLKLKQRKATAEEVRSYTAFQKATDKKAKRPLLLAALESEDADTLTYLLTADPDLSVDYRRTTALHWTIKRYETVRDPWLLDVCIAAGCSIEKPDGDGKTALSLCVAGGLLDLLYETLKRYGRESDTKRMESLLPIRATSSPRLSSRSALV